MKIGILTQPLRYNYGGILQNYALQQTLIRLGHEPETLNYENNKRPVTWIVRLSVLKKFILHWISPNKFRGPKYALSNDEREIIWKNTMYFINKYIVRTQPLLSHEDFVILARSKRYQGYVVGSDQCWRPRYNKTFLKEMFLNFIQEQNDIKRVGYAVSFGSPDWEMNPELTLECSRLSHKFDVITVREKDGISLCKEKLGVEAKMVLDPTMLLKREDYENLSDQEHETNSKGNLFYYLLDPNKSKLFVINEVATKQGLIPFTVMPKYKSDSITKEEVRNNLDDCVYPSVTKWIRAFMDAEMTIVDSFHGMVFSIIFNKPFWVIGNKKRGMSRFLSLLGVLGLEDRLLEVEKLRHTDIELPIDWSSVNNKITGMRNLSLELLKDSLTI